MSIITKYVSKNFLTFFGGTLFVLVFVVFMGQFSRIFTYAMQYGANIFWVMSMMIYIVPDILVLSIPMACQIGILMTLTTMSQTGEVIALRAAGLSFKEIAKPLFYFCMFLSILMISLNGFFSPIARKSLDDSKKELASRISKVSVEPRTFINLGSWELYTEESNKKDKTLTQVYLTRKNDDDALNTKINATKGKIEVEKDFVNITLFQGQMQRLDKNNFNKLITAEFNKFSLLVPLITQEKKTQVLTDKVVEVSTPQIFMRIIDKSVPQEVLGEFMSEPATRFAWALAPLIFFLLSCPVAFVSDKRASRGLAMLYSLMFIFGYFGLMTLMNNLAKKLPIIWLCYTLPLFTPFLSAIVGKYLWNKRLNN